MTNGVGVMVNLPLARFGKAIARRVWRRLGKFFMLVGMVHIFITIYQGEASLNRQVYRVS